MADFRPEEKDVVYIGEGVTLTGAIQAQDTVVVDGVVDGEVSCSQLIVGPTGVVNGTIAVSEADVYGKIGSDITVKQLLTVRSSGRVEGKWTYGEIEVEKGGVLSGSAESTEYRGMERKVPKEERASHSSFRKPELIVSEAEQGETRVATLASRALRERKRI
ncbi:MAG TPA: polymer-forming cytoskeletal protein [Methylocystis sp.]|nr:polymer-forming cytoskeletal protein [Methylocystis sp.]